MLQGFYIGGIYRDTSLLKANRRLCERADEDKIWISIVPLVFLYVLLGLYFCQLYGDYFNKTLA